MPSPSMREHLHKASVHSKERSTALGAVRARPLLPAQTKYEWRTTPHLGSSSLKQRSFFSQDMCTAPGPKPIYSGEKSHK